MQHFHFTGTAAVFNFGFNPFGTAYLQETLIGSNFIFPNTQKIQFRFLTSRINGDGDFLLNRAVFHKAPAIAAFCFSNKLRLETGRDLHCRRFPNNIPGWRIGNFNFATKLFGLVLEKIQVGPHLQVYDLSRLGLVVGLTLHTCERCDPLYRKDRSSILIDQLNLGFLYLIFGLCLFAGRSSSKQGCIAWCVAAGSVANIFMWWYGKRRTNCFSCHFAHLDTCNTSTESFSNPHWYCCLHFNLWDRIF